jgi:heat shock protein HslJ
MIRATRRISMTTAHRYIRPHMTHLSLVPFVILLAAQPALGQEPQLGDKYTDGVSFTATDSLLSWSLDITFQDRMTLGAPVFGDRPFEAVIDTVKRQEEGRILFYHAVSSRAEVLVMLQASEGKGGSRYAVQAEVMPAEGGAMTLHKGSGRFLPPQELHYAWRLVSFNGEAIDPKRFRDAPPAIAFQVPLGTVTGTTGCNDISGDFSAGYRTLRFGRLVGTRMHCPPVEDLEERYVNALSGRDLRYSVTSSELRLRHSDGTELVFKRVR